jgi:hypothetical protein
MEEKVALLKTSMVNHDMYLAIYQPYEFIGAVVVVIVW